MRIKEAKSQSQDLEEREEQKMIPVSSETGFHCTDPCTAEARKTHMPIKTHARSSFAPKGKDVHT